MLPSRVPVNESCRPPSLPGKEKWQWNWTLDILVLQTGDTVGLGIGGFSVLRCSSKSYVQAHLALKLFISWTGLLKQPTPSQIQSIENARDVHFISSLWLLWWLLQHLQLHIYLVTALVRFCAYNVSKQCVHCTVMWLVKERWGKETDSWATTQKRWPTNQHTPSLHGLNTCAPEIAKWNT